MSISFSVLTEAFYIIKEQQYFTGYTVIQRLQALTEKKFIFSKKCSSFQAKYSLFRTKCSLLRENVHYFKQNVNHFRHTRKALHS